LRLAKVFGTSPEFWLNRQLALNLYRVINEVEKIEPVRHQIAVFPSD
jgi:plasmid maintenance system antidote protein VapI